MILRSHSIPDDAEDAAIWWATKRHTDPERFKTDRRFELWLEDPQNDEAWRAYEERDAILGSFAIEPELCEMRREALQQVQGPRRSRHVWAWSGAIAASLVLAVVGLNGIADTREGRVASTSQENVLQFATAHGQRRDVRLADGSTIALNSNTTLEVNYSSALREIRLLQGQALFRVAKDSSRPFVVAAAGQRITATGTAFDVEVERNGNVRVLLVEGHVNVEPIRPTGAAKFFPALDRVELEPGQQLHANSKKEAVVTTADVESGTAWQRGLIVLRDDTLAEAVGQFNRYADVPIVLGSADLGRLRVSGVFPTGREEDFLAAMEVMHGLKVEASTRQKVLRKQAFDSSPR